MPAPFIEELSSPRGGVVIPELPKGFLEKVGPDALKVVAQEIAEAESLLACEVLLAFEQEPARFLQDRVKSFLFHAARLVSADIVESLVHLCHDVEPVEDMEGIGALLADDLQIGFPHVGTNEDDLRGHLVADGGEESSKGLDRSFFSDPKQARDIEIDLVNQREVLMTFGVLDLVDADGVDGTEFAVC